MNERDDHLETGSIGPADDVSEADSAAGGPVDAGGPGEMAAAGAQDLGDAGAVDEGTAEAAHAKPRYMAVFAGLAILTVLEVSLAFMGFDRSVTILVLLGLAVWKALLVAMYYMHLRWEPIPVRLVAAAPLVPAAILILIVMFEY